MSDLWNGLLDFLSRFVTPDWASLIAIIPLGLAAIVALFLLGIALAFALAGPVRRGRRPARPVPPPGVHAPEPSLAPLFVAIGAAVLFFGIVLKGPILVAGVVVTVAALLYWGREAMRDYARLDSHDLAASGAAAVDTGLRPLESLAGAPLPRLRPPAETIPPTPEGVHLPEPSFRPVLVSIAAAVVFFGIVMGPAILAAGILMLVIALVGWLTDARAEYRATVVTERTGHVEHRTAPRIPVGTLALFAVLFVVGAGFRAGVLPPSVPPVPSPGQGTSGGAPAGGASPTLPAANSSATGPAKGGQGAAATLKVTAQNIKFDVQSLTAPANTGFTIDFTNQDAGVAHDIVIHKDSASGQAVFSGEAFSGPASKTYSVPALPAGTYTFVCSIHPTLMTGTLTVR